MVQNLRLGVQWELTEDIMKYISRRINPTYLRAQLRNLNVPDIKCSECGTTTYELTEAYKEIPTDDLTLRLNKGNFYGSASGEEQSDKLVIKAIALRKIQEILKDRGITSRMDFSGLDDFDYARLGLYKLVNNSLRKGRLKSCRRLLGEVVISELQRRQQANLEYLHRN